MSFNEEAILSVNYHFAHCLWTKYL